MSKTISESELVQVIHGFSSAAVDPARWRNALLMTADAVGAVTCTTDFVDLQTGEASLEWPIELDADVWRDYEERVVHISPRVRAAIRSETAVLLEDQQLQPADDPETPEFLDWLSKTPGRFIQGCKLADQGGQVVFYSAHYAEQQGPASHEQSRFQRALIPHLVNTIQVSRALSDNRLRNDLVTYRQLDSDKSFALLDRAGCLSECSKGFEAILRSSELLGFRNRRLIGRHSSHRDAVARFLAAASGPHRSIDPPLPIRLSDPSNPRGLVLRAIPFPPSEDLFDAFRPAALMTLVNLDAPAKACSAELATLFGLTTREAEVAAVIAEGQSIERASSTLSISQHTVKQHLKAVFGKMYIERQADLVTIVARLGSADHDRN